MPPQCRSTASAQHAPSTQRTRPRARAASGNDWLKDRQFHALNAEAGVVEVKAVRGGHECLVVNEAVVVGDVLLLDTGDRVAADGLAFEAHGLTIDEVRRAPACTRTATQTLVHGTQNRYPRRPVHRAGVLRHRCLRYPVHRGGALLLFAAALRSLRRTSAAACCGARARQRGPAAARARSLARDTRAPGRGGRLTGCRAAAPAGLADRRERAHAQGPARRRLLQVGHRGACPLQRAARGLTSSHP